MKKRENQVKYGSLLKYRYRVNEKLGRGSFGDVYAATDITNYREVAIKVETGKKNCRQVLEVEMNVMRALQKSPYVVKLLDSGKVGSLVFVVMERLGPDLSVLRKSQKNRQFSLFTTLHLGIQMINILESVHNMGLIHRDIKPSNFCIGRGGPEGKQVFLIDFSLARRYRYHTGKIRSPRRKVGFRGTSRFASINSHRGLDLYPRDDLWSVWYTMIEMYLGRLPWEGLKDRKQVGLLKSRFNVSDVYKKVPIEFERIRKYLYSASYRKLPDYEYLRSILISLFHKRSYVANRPLDWESTSDSSGFGSFSSSAGSGAADNEGRERPGLNECYSPSSFASVGSSTFSCRSMGVQSVKSFKSSRSDAGVYPAFPLPNHMVPRGRSNSTSDPFGSEGRDGSRFETPPRRSSLITEMDKKSSSLKTKSNLSNKTTNGSKNPVQYNLNPKVRKAHNNISRFEKARPLSLDFERPSQVIREKRVSRFGYSESKESRMNPFHRKYSGSPVVKRKKRRMSIPVKRANPDEEEKEGEKERPRRRSFAKRKSSKIHPAATKVIKSTPPGSSGSSSSSPRKEKKRADKEKKRNKKKKNRKRDQKDEEEQKNGTNGTSSKTDGESASEGGAKTETDPGMSNEELNKVIAETENGISIRNLKFDSRSSLSSTKSNKRNKKGRCTIL